MDLSSADPSASRGDNYSQPSSNGDVSSRAASQWVEEPPEELNLKQLLDAIKRRWLVIAGVVLILMSFNLGYTLTRKPIYGGRFRMLVEPVDNTNPNLSGLTSRTNTAAQEQTPIDYQTQILVLLNPALLKNTTDKLRKTYPGLDPIDLAQRLTIQRVEETKILEIGYQSADPAEVEAVLNQLSKDYLEYSLKQRQTNLRQGIKFIQDQLPSIKSRVDQLQTDLQRFRQRNGFIEPSVQASQIADQNNQLSLQRIAIDQSLAQTRSSLGTLQNEQGVTAALAGANIYQSLIGQLRQLETQIAAERTRFQDGSLSIRILEERRNNLLPLLRDEAKRLVGEQTAARATQIQVLEIQRQAIAQSQRQLDRKTEELSFQIRKYTDLQRELQVATDSLNRFLATREALQIEASQRELPWQIVQAPFRFPTPVSPNIRRNLILGLIGSLVLGLSLALTIEKLDDTYHNIEELKAKTKLPLLGVISRQRELQEMETVLLQERKALANLAEINHLNLEEGEGAIANPQLALQNSSKFLTSFQVLCTKIQLLSPDQQIRSIVVSSASAADGKSTVALYMAQTAAEMGQRVLLVDADLRGSQLQARLGLNQAEGLSNLIAQQLSLHEVIYRPLQKVGFFVLPAGDLPPNPVRLLSSNKMKTMMEEVSRLFDLVIYDVPAMDGLADTSLLAPYTDGIVLVVRFGKTERFVLTQTLDNLKLSQMPILGIVANGV
jgi:capsular exopolysaccharide synthesis family protein